MPSSASNPPQKYDFRRNDASNLGFTSPRFFPKLTAAPSEMLALLIIRRIFVLLRLHFSLHSSKREGAGWGISQKQILILRSNCTCERIFAADDSYVVKGCSKK